MISINFLCCGHTNGFGRFRRNVNKALRWAQKVFGVCTPIYVRRDSGSKNYPIYLKFGINVYLLCKIRSIIFAVRCSNDVCIGMLKIISMH